MKNAWTGECNQLDVYTTMMDLMDIKSNWRGLGHSLVSPAYKGSLTDKKWNISEWIIKSGYFDNNEE